MAQDDIKMLLAKLHHGYKFSLDELKTMVPRFDKRQLRQRVCDGRHLYEVQGIDRLTMALLKGK